MRNGCGWIGDFHRIFDWTGSRITVTNEEIERRVPDGTPEEIRP